MQRSYDFAILGCIENPLCEKARRDFRSPMLYPVELPFVDSLHEQEGVEPSTLGLAYPICVADCVLKVVGDEGFEPPRLAHLLPKQTRYQATV